ncbi:phage tail tape measure protein, partial [Pseudomonas sp. FW305-BF6]|uniref:phage tail tape measure protein n=1 Tax=Pseudomonas sp. FW305-BF6 TaxID=2070673 RepID=UPI001C479091
MARRSFEMTFQIGGNLARSFSSSFTRATSSLTDLKNQSRQTQRALDQLGNDFRRGSITQNQYASSTERLTRELRQLENAQNRINAMGNGFNTVRSAAGMAAIGTAAVSSAAAVSSVKKSMSFEAQLSSIQALTNASNKEMAKMHDLSLEMGASTKYSALEAAQGIEELLKAGISPAKVEAGALEAALNLATAGGLELSEAAETMSTALNAFSKDGMTAAQASNILAGTANASATGVHELRYSLSMVSAVAAGAGLSFEDTNAALGVFANKG